MYKFWETSVNSLPVPRRGFAGLCLALLVGLFAGCASMDMGKTPEEIVLKRAQARMDALLAWDLKAALKYQTPAYRETFGIDDLASSYNGARRWISAEVTNAVCEDTRCTVTVLIDYEIIRPRVRNKKPIAENWVLVDGRWYASS